MRKYILIAAIASMHFFSANAGNKYQVYSANSHRSTPLADTGIFDLKYDLCPGPKNDISTKPDPKLEMIISLIIEKTAGANTNSIILYGCSEIANVQAAMHEGKNYILFNPSFINQNNLKVLVGNSNRLVADDSTWIVSAILAHEYSHFTLGHLTNPTTSSTIKEMEIEADEASGFIVYLLGGSLKQARLAYQKLPETGTYNFPDRQARLDAVERGYLKAKKMYKLR